MKLLNWWPSGGFVYPAFCGCCLLISLSAGALGQTGSNVMVSPTAASSTATPQVPQVARDLNSTVLQLESVLAEEAKEHREFLRDSLEELKWFVAGIVGVGIAILTLLNMKSQRDIRNQVNARFKADVDALVTNKVTQFEQFVERTQKDTEKNLNQLTGSFHDLVNGLTFAFAALDEGRTTAEWDSARRLAI